MIETILPQEQVEKSEDRESSRLRNQTRKNYKSFIPQSKIPYLITQKLTIFSQLRPQKPSNQKWQISLK